MQLEGCCMSWGRDDYVGPLLLDEHQTTTAWFLATTLQLIQSVRNYKEQQASPLQKKDALCEHDLAAEAWITA